MAVRDIVGYYRGRPRVSTWTPKAHRLLRSSMYLGLAIEPLQTFPENYTIIAF